MASMTLARLPASIASADNLPSPPGLAVQVMRLSEDPNARAEDLGRLIRADPALTIRLLRTVNSAAHGLPRTIDSVERACALLGFRQAKTVALGFAVADALPVVGPETGFDLDEYWLRSGLTATAAELFARHASPDHADVAFVVGLLSEVGRLVLASCVTDTYGSVLAEDAWPAPALEASRLGFSNLDVASAMFREWMLPPEIFEPIAYRDEPSALPIGSSSDVIRLCRILATAEILVRVWMSGAARRDLNWAGDAAWHYLHIPAEDFVGIVDTLRQGVESHETFRVVSPPQAVDLRGIEKQASDRLREATAASSSGSRVADLLRGAKGRYA